MSKLPVVRDFQAHELYAERAALAHTPKILLGLDSRARKTWITGMPSVPKGARLAPAPPQLPLLGHFKTLGTGTARLRNVLQMRADYGDIVRLRFGGMTAHLVSHPDAIYEVLHSRNREFDKHTRGLFTLRLVLGTGLLTNQGESWLKQRRIAQPAFHRKQIESFAGRIVVAAEDMCRGWQDGQVVDVHHAMMQVAMRIVGETLLGTDVTQDADAVGVALDEALGYLNRRVNSLLPINPQLPTRENRAFMKASRTLDHLVMDMIARRRESGAENIDLLQLLMDARDVDTGESMSDRQLRDEVMTMFLAGHETTANALSWSLHLLGESPSVGEKLHNEVASVLGDRSATISDTSALVYTKQVIEEAMRLYPPAWMLARAPVHDTELSGYFMPARSLLLISPYVTHRHPAFWRDPHVFDPERFSPENRAIHHKFAYFPFGGGPRQCIGNNFALMEAQLVLATMARHYRLEPVPGEVVEAEPLVTLRPTRLRMVVRRH